MEKDSHPLLDQFQNQRGEDREHYDLTIAFLGIFGKCRDRVINQPRGIYFGSRRSLAAVPGGSHLFESQTLLNN